MNYQNILATIALLGLGALIPKIFDFIFEKQKVKENAKHEFKQGRYKAVILLMYSYINFDREKDRLQIHRPELKNEDDLIEELKTEWTNMTLYASDNVIKSMKLFFRSPEVDTYCNVTLAMRKDLYNINSKLTLSDIKID